MGFERKGLWPTTWLCRTCHEIFYTDGTEEWPNHCFKKVGTQMTFYDADEIIREELSDTAPA